MELIHRFDHLLDKVNLIVGEIVLRVELAVDVWNALAPVDVAVVFIILNRYEFKFIPNDVLSN
jgi:hypothetical protein